MFSPQTDRDNYEKRLHDVQKRLKQMGDVARDADDKEEELHNMHQQFMQLQVKT